jgi:putative ABC transport system permease protein
VSILRDIFRRRARSVITISGIAIGMFALVVLGAISENLNVYVENAAAYFENAIMVMDAEEGGPLGMPTGGRPLSAEKIEEVARIPGVRACLPAVFMLLDESVTSVGASAPPMIMGFAPGFERYDTAVSVSQGRTLDGGESGVAVVGPDLAKQRRLEVGDNLQVRGEDFKVIGILKRTYISLNDASVYLPIGDARRLYVATLPAAFRDVVKPEAITMAGLAYVEPGRDAVAVAAAIEHGVQGVKTLDKEKMFSTLSSYLALFNTVLASLAALGLIVGGLTIVNTMTMAVTERTRELGVKRALGASRSRIAREVLAESAVMGALGGLGGLALGALASLVIGGAVTSATGVNMFMLTWRLAVFAMGFAVSLGTFAGLYPAWRASRMDPVQALAYE